MLKNKFSVQLQNKLIYGLTFISILVYIILCIWIKPSMYSDSAWGFLTMDSMLRGSNFNFTIEPNSLDISKNIEVFGATWTPGQYFINYLLIKYIGLNLGISMIITVISMSISGLIGLYHIYKKLNFSNEIIAISIFCIALQRFFSLPFSIYNGGDALIFGFGPWFLLIALKFRALGIKNLFILLVIGIVGFFLKTSFIIAFIALCLFLLLNFSESKQLINMKNTLLLLKIIAVLMSLFIICYQLFIKKGLYNHQSFQFKFNLTESLFTLASSWASTFSIDDLFKRIFEYPGNTYLTTQLKYISILYYGFFACISFYIFKTIYILKGYTKYKLILFSFTLTYVTIFLFFYNKTEPTSSLEMRHFRLVGLLCLPGVLVLIKNTKAYLLKKTISTIIAISLIYGPFSLLQRKYGALNNYVAGSRGFTLSIIDKEALNKLTEIDTRSDTNTLLYITSPDIALEVKNARKIVSHADFDTLDALRNNKYHGKSNNLYLILQKHFTNNGKEQAIFNSFKNYQNFQLIYSSSSFNFFKAIN